MTVPFNGGHCAPVIPLPLRASNVRPLVDTKGQQAELRQVVLDILRYGQVPVEMEELARLLPNLPDTARSDRLRVMLDTAEQLVYWQGEAEDGEHRASARSEAAEWSKRLDMDVYHSLLIRPDAPLAIRRSATAQVSR